MVDIMKADLDKISGFSEELARKKAEISYPLRAGIDTTSPIGMMLSSDAIVDSTLTIPLAMTCFSIINVLGRIVDFRTKKKSDEIQSGEFIDSARALFDFIESDYLKNRKSAQRLQNVYRHSIMHSFLPAVTNTIAYHITMYKNFQDEPLFLEREDQVILNVRCLYKLTGKALTKIAEVFQGIGKSRSHEVVKMLDNFAVILTKSREKSSTIDL